MERYIQRKRVDAINAGCLGPGLGFSLDEEIGHYSSSVFHTDLTAFFENILVF